MAKKGNRRCDTLPVLHPDAAGIDVGASDTSPSALIEAHNPSAAFPHSLAICTRRLTVSSSAGFTL